MPQEVILMQIHLMQLGLMQIQLEVKEKKFQAIWRKSIYHGILNLSLNVILCFSDHNDKSSLTVCCCSNIRDIQMTFGCR